MKINIDFKRLVIIKRCRQTLYNIYTLIFSGDTLFVSSIPLLLKHPPISIRVFFLYLRFTLSKNLFNNNFMLITFFEITHLYIY